MARTYSSSTQHPENILTKGKNLRCPLHPSAQPGSTVLDMKNLKLCLLVGVRHFWPPGGVWGQSPPGFCIQACGGASVTMHDHREKDEHCFCGFQNTIFNSVRAAGNAAQLCCFGASRGFILYRYRWVIVVVGLTAGVVGDSFKNHHEHSHQQGEKQRELLMHSVEICLDTPPNYWAGLWRIQEVL